MVPYNVYMQKRAGEPQTYAKELQLPGERAIVWGCGHHVGKEKMGRLIVKEYLWVWVCLSSPEWVNKCNQEKMLLDALKKKNVKKKLLQCLTSQQSGSTWLEWVSDPSGRCEGSLILPSCSALDMKGSSRFMSSKLFLFFKEATLSSICTVVFQRKFSCFPFRAVQDLSSSFFLFFFFFSLSFNADLFFTDGWLLICSSFQQGNFFFFVYRLVLECFAKN